MFAGLIVLGQFSPGPDMVLLTRTALRDGSKAGMEMAVGIACGLAVHSTIAVGGRGGGVPAVSGVAAGAAMGGGGLSAVAGLRVVAGGVASPGSSGAVRMDEAKENPHPPFVRGLVVQFVQPEGGVVSGRGVRAVSSRKSSRLVAVAIWGVIVGLGIGLWSLWVVLLQWRPLRVRYERPQAGSTGFSASRWRRWRCG